MTTINLEMITQYEQLRDAIEDRMTEVAKQLFEIQHGKSMDSRHTRYYFETFYVRDREMTGDCVVSVTLTSSDQTYDSKNIVFPFSYLENDDWQQPLREQMDWERAELKRMADEKITETSAKRRSAIEARERKTFERLRAKFGQST